MSGVEIAAVHRTRYSMTSTSAISSVQQRLKRQKGQRLASTDEHRTSAISLGDQSHLESKANTGEITECHLVGVLITFLRCTKVLLPRTQRADL